MVSLRKRSLWINRRVSLLLGRNRKSVVSKGPSTASSKLPEAGTHVLMKSYGVMISSRTTMILIYKNISASSVAYLVLYINDILLIGNDDRSRRMLGLTQSSYIDKVLKRFKMEHSKRELLHMRHGVKLSKKQSPKTDEKLKRMLSIPYASAVGSISVCCPVHQTRYRLRFERNKQISGMRRGGALGRGQEHS
ncbi:UNVERIFIED_CONTAM: hypothetical protein Slati_1704800 [Sesamum latifolium]|uniref:Reverse transcriptase Ty1/copia-type domain-containing protein n=1 Tax=Sesamum latifolium TaxID=2727402 RepID=A0AAW2WXV6_9LAMI